MGGFKNETTNVEFDAGVINTIIAHLIKCSKQMKEDCIAADNLLKNDEDAITNRLTVYLNAGPNILRYESQSPEHYNDGTDRYIGRTDIKVISGDYFRDAKAYHIVECKRIDGTNTLNRKYIKDGVARFFTPTPKPKYSSYYMLNIMFGYVVRAIDVSDNADKIDKLQHSLLKKLTITNFVLKQNDNSQYYVYTCDYSCACIGRIELSHLFFNLSNAICEKILRKH
jgi:hypothetical protein